MRVCVNDGLGKEFRCCFIIITSFNLFKFEVMPKIVNTALKAKAKAWTFEAKAKAKAKAKATGPEAKAKAIKFGLEAPRGQGLASRTTSLDFVSKSKHHQTVLTDVRTGDRQQLERWEEDSVMFSLDTMSCLDAILRHVSVVAYSWSKIRTKTSTHWLWL